LKNDDQDKEEDKQEEADCYIGPSPGYADPVRVLVQEASSIASFSRPIGCIISLGAGPELDLKP
jgi:hypothetical protein